MPAIPPILSNPLTVPENEHIVMVPWFFPARPPRTFLRSAGEMLPETWRSRTEPVGVCTETVPAPLPLPGDGQAGDGVSLSLKGAAEGEGMGAKSTPVRSWSASR